MKRRTFDSILSITGFVLTAVLVAAGVLLSWGASFANNTVRDQLSEQKISFTGAETFEGDCLAPLASWADKAVDSAESAQAYSDVIKCHMQGILAGAGLATDETYSTLGRARALAAEAAAMPETTPAEQEAKAAKLAEVDKLNGIRATIFQGETLRSILLTAYAFGTLGAVALVASYVAFGLAALMLVLSLLGVMHLKRTAPDATI